MHISYKKELSKEEKEKRQKEARKQYEKDQEPVRGTFYFHEVPGGTLTFPFRKYKWQSIESYTLVDGQTYTIPRGVAQHLNEGTAYPVHRHILDAQGKPMVTNEKKKRTSFQSSDFITAVQDDKKKADKITVVVPEIPEAPSALVNVMK